MIGLLSIHFSLGDSIAGFTVAAYALVVVTAWVLPETRGRVLCAEDERAVHITESAVET